MLAAFSGSEIFVKAAGRKLGCVIGLVVLWSACGGRTLDAWRGPGDDASDGDSTARGGKSSMWGSTAGSSARGGSTSKPSEPSGDAAAGGLPAEGGSAGEGGAPDFGPISDGIFDPGQVYLHGTLSEGACYMDALAHWATPNQAMTGFDCDVYWTGINPVDGRFVFEQGSYDDTTLYAFTPDGNGYDEYPQAPYANDIPFDTVCVNPRGYFLDPDGGPPAYSCYGSPPCVDTECLYYDEFGNDFEVPEGYYLVHRGFDGSQLLRVADDFDETWAVMAPGGVITELIDQPISSTIRAHASGFWILIGHERWNVAFDGTFTMDGRYPDPPPSSQYEGQCAFESSGALLCFGRSTDVVFEDHILRAELDADVAELVYTEASDPRVKIHISYLVTGP
jgi:hypothetical protein